MGNYNYGYLIESARMAVNVIAAINASVAADKIDNAQLDDIAWAKVTKTGSSLADLITRSAADLSSGDLAAARMSVNVISAINAATSGIIELGGSGSGNRYAFIDFHGDDTYSDYGLRIMRSNSGANAESKIGHRGTGDFSIVTVEAAPIKLITHETSPEVTIDASGNLIVGGTDAGASAVSVFRIVNGTIPTSSPANSIQLYAEDVVGSSELKVRDEAGIVTTLSPHHFEMFEPLDENELPWSYHSESKQKGKAIEVDMLGAIKAIEELTGKKFIYYKDIPKET